MIARGGAPSPSEATRSEACASSLSGPPPSVVTMTRVGSNSSAALRGMRQKRGLRAVILMENAMAAKADCLCLGRQRVMPENLLNRRPEICGHPVVGGLELEAGDGVRARAAYERIHASRTTRTRGEGGM